LAAELENQLSASSELIQSSGGVFEIQDGGTLLYSKKATGRFPEEGEVLAIVKGIEEGLPLAQAQEKAGAQAKQPPSFFDWFKGMLGEKR